MYLPKSIVEPVPVSPLTVIDELTNVALTLSPATTVKSIPDAPVVSVKLPDWKIAVSAA
jgi:hypothetical protein